VLPWVLACFWKWNDGGVAQLVVDVKEVKTGGDWKVFDEVVVDTIVAWRGV